MPIDYTQSSLDQKNLADKQLQGLPIFEKNLLRKYTT